MMIVLRTIIALLLIVFNTVWVGIVLTILGVIRAIIPFRIITTNIVFLLQAVSSLWSDINRLTFRVLGKIEWDISLPDGLSRDKSYVVLSNHVSALDIPICFQTLCKIIPFPRYFSKQEVLYIPFLGTGTWAMDAIFMKRYTRAYLRKNPHKRGKDFETTIKRCQRFKNHPVSILNYVEGTRATKDKIKKHGSRYKNLLSPKAGGVAVAMGILSEKVDCVLDMTIVYDCDNPSITAWLKGDITKITITVKKIVIPENIKKGDYVNDKEYKNSFQIWLKNLWNKKDQLISTINQNN